MFSWSEANGERTRTLFSFIPFNAFIYWSNRFNKFLCVMSLKRFKIREKCKFRSLYNVLAPFALHLLKIAFPNNICEIMRGEVLRMGREGSFFLSQTIKAWKLRCWWKAVNSYIYLLKIFKVNKNAPVLSPVIRLSFRINLYFYKISVYVVISWIACSQTRSCANSDIYCVKEEINNLLLGSPLCWHISCRPGQISRQFSPIISLCLSHNSFRTEKSPKMSESGSRWTCDMITNWIAREKCSKNCLINFKYGLWCEKDLDSRSEVYFSLKNVFMDF